MAKNKESKGISLAKGPVAILGLALLAYGITGLIFGGQSFSSNPVDGTINGEKWLGLEVNGWSSLLFIAAGALLLFGAPLHWGAKTMSLVVGLALGAASVIALVDKSDVFGIFAANGLTKLVWGAAAALLLILALLPRVGGKKKDTDDYDRDRTPDTRRVERTVQREPVRERTVVEREPVRERNVVEREPIRERVSEREPVRERTTRVERDTLGENDGSRSTRIDRDDDNAGSRVARADNDSISDGGGSRSGSRRVVAPADGTTPESQETTRRQREHGEF